MGFLSKLKELAATPPEIAAGRSNRPSRSGEGFAVIDVETTGLDPYEDRIIEIGIVVLDPRARTVSEWATVLNPGPRVAAGATHVHGVETAWLAAGPAFADVAHEVAQRLSGRFVVAHNAKFDCAFLEEEFARIGYRDFGELRSVCTLDIADKLGLPRRLPSLCVQLGVPHQMHDALGDAQASAEVFRRLLRFIDPGTFRGVPGSDMGSVPLSGPVVRCIRRDEARAATRVRPVIGPLIESLPPLSTAEERDPRATSAYLSALEDALTDGYLSPEEVLTLTRLAQRLGLTGEEVRDLHQAFIMNMLHFALSDRRISKEERTEIERAAGWLGVNLSEWDAMVKAARTRIKAEIAGFRSELRGRRVAFSGRGMYTEGIREARPSSTGSTTGGPCGLTPIC